jgi:nucleoside-diphosphate-sugar epimerase
MKKVCLIGGSGFVGTRLINRLKNRPWQFDILNLDKNASEQFPDLTRLADVRSPEQLSQIPRGAILVNLAAEHRDDVQPVSLYHDVNVIGAKNLCDAARSCNVKKIIFTSSVAVYGFAPVGTGENGRVAPFNEYGRTKFEAEEVFRCWYEESPLDRTLIIIRPTVIFGEGNRGNVYNLLRQLASRRFVMVGSGRNRKSMAYVENVAAFIEFSLDGFAPGCHLFNYVDAPDFTMNDLVSRVNDIMGRRAERNWRIPYVVGIAAGALFDFVSVILRKKFIVSAVRVKKFCADSVYSSSVAATGFQRPVDLERALEQTVRSEFLGDGKRS